MLNPHTYIHKQTHAHLAHHLHHFYAIALTPLWIPRDAPTTSGTRARDLETVVSTFGTATTTTTAKTRTASATTATGIATTARASRCGGSVRRCASRRRFFRFLRPAGLDHACRANRFGVRGFARRFWWGHGPRCAAHESSRRHGVPVVCIWVSWWFLVGVSSFGWREMWKGK